MNAAALQQKLHNLEVPLRNRPYKSGITSSWEQFLLNVCGKPLEEVFISGFISSMSLSHKF